MQAGRAALVVAEQQDRPCLEAGPSLQAVPPAHLQHISRLHKYVNTRSSDLKICQLMQVGVAALVAVGQLARLCLEAGPLLEAVPPAPRGEGPGGPTAMRMRLLSAPPTACPANGPSRARRQILVRDMSCLAACMCVYVRVHVSVWWRRG